MAVKDRKDRARKVLSAKRMADATSSKASRAFVVPDGIPLFAIKKAGEYELNIVPFTSSMATASYDADSLAAARPYYCHKGIGPNKDTYLCNARTFGEPCPVCEHGAILERDPESTDDQKKATWPSQRALWLVEDVKEAPGELKLFDYAHHTFGRHVFAKTQRRPEYDAFADPEVGLTLQIGANEAGSGKMKYFDCNDIQFVKREPLDAALLDTAPCLDDCIKAAKISYDEMKSLYYEGGGVGEEEPVARGDDKVKDDTNEETNGQLAPTNRRRAAPAEAPNDDPTAKECGFEIGMQVEHEEFGVCTIVKISPDGTSIRLEDEEMGIHTAIAPRDCTLVEPDPAEEVPEEEPEQPRRRATAPQTQTRKAPAKGGRDLDFDEEPEEELEEPEEVDEAPKQRTTAPAATTRKAPPPTTTRPTTTRRR